MRRSPASPLLMRTTAVRCCSRCRARIASRSTGWSKPQRPPAARLIPVRGRTMESCTAAASRTPTATIGSRCGWTRNSPSRARTRSRRPHKRPRPEPIVCKQEETMPLNPNAPIEITAFSWVPEFAQGLVRDLRARWALEEAGLDYRVRLVGQQRPAEYLQEQPFDQVPCFSDGRVKIFETGAIVQYVGENSEALLPREPQAKYRAIQWTYAALNSVEPALLNLFLVDVFYKDEEWAKLRRPGAADFARL